MGVVIRTAAAKAAAEEIENDLRQLLASWQVLLRRSKWGGPQLLYRELDLSIRMIRDYVTKDVQKNHCR